MPLFRRKSFPLLEPPDDLQSRELVFQIRFTKEIFRDYQEYLKRMNMYRKRVWACKVTGKGNLTYEEALVSEQRASAKVQQLPEELIGPILRIVQYNMLPLKELIPKIKAHLQENLVKGVEVHGKKDGGIHPCNFVKVLDEKEGITRYKATVCEDDSIRNKFPFSREFLKSFIREATYRSLPWVLHSNLATKYGISTDPPESLNGKISFLNGCVVSCKKRKNEEPQEEPNGKLKRSLSEKGKSDSPISDEIMENGGDSIKYPIDDRLVKPGPDDPVFTDRPSPSRDFTIQMDCFGDLLMVWDFCSSFGRLLNLWPYSLEDFEKALCHKGSSVALLVETHTALLQLLLKDEGEYYTVSKKKKRKIKITLITWTEYLCDFIEMVGVSELTTHAPTIKRGHYGLLEPPAKVRILKELVDHVMATDLVRQKLDETLEQRHALGAEKRGKALEEGKMKREAIARLKATAESNGTVIEDSSGHVEDNSSNGEISENGQIEKSSIDLKQSFENGVIDPKTNGLHEKTKKLLDDLERSKEQRKEFLEKEMEKHAIRTNSLGKDRDYNRYWFFRRDGRIFIESCDSKQWGFYCSKEELDALMGSLNLKGERERGLKTHLDKHYSKISKELQKRSKEMADRIAEENAVLRRSSRVRAPPKDNPALAFLKYINKWKVSMD